MTISESERTLIDRFLAENCVTKIPMGKSAFKVEYVWTGFKLTSTEPENVVARQNRFMHRNRPVNNINGAIRKLFDEGKTDAEISAVVGVSEVAVKNRRHGMRLARKRPATPEQMEKRLELILMMREGGMTQAAIAKVLGVSSTTVWDALQHHKMRTEA